MNAVQFPLGVFLHLCWKRATGDMQHIFTFCMHKPSQSTHPHLKLSPSPSLPLSLSPVFCRYQQIYDIFNMSCLGVIFHVRGRDGMSTPQNGAATYSQSHVFATVVSRCHPCSFRLPECSPPMAGPPELQRLSSDFAVFSHQPATDADSAYPTCKTLPCYSYLVAVPW